MGSNNLAGSIASYEMQQIEKEQKRKNFADDLKKQIEERDFIRKKEEWRATKAQSFMKDRLSDQQPVEQAPSPMIKPNETHYFDPRITKQDFPDIKTRARVLDNRVDLQLER